MEKGHIVTLQSLLSNLKSGIKHDYILEFQDPLNHIGIMI